MTDQAPLVAPIDPRSSQPVVPFGQMPRLTTLDERVVRVLAPNQNAFSLDGTNTYVVTSPEGAAVVIDPGPPDPEHLARVRDALATADVACEAILVTHHHLDHSEAALAWSRQLGSPVMAASRDVAGPDGTVLADGATVRVGRESIGVLTTPGHTSDHLAFRLPTGALMVGDHILGRGTSVIAGPDGDLTAYLDSLRRVLDVGANALYPGHGPEMTDEPMAVVEYYLAHREYRKQQILRALAVGPRSVSQLVEQIYAEVGHHLWDAAGRSTRAALIAFQDEGVVTLSKDDVATLTGDGPA
jgi:glyoxylase-like metal-dependent hydrolase (beta-lactamase superfamily II)